MLACGRVYHFNIQSSPILSELCICSLVGYRTHCNIERDPVASLPRRGNWILFNLHIATPEIHCADASFNLIKAFLCTNSKHVKLIVIRRGQLSSFRVHQAP